MLRIAIIRYRCGDPLTSNPLPTPLLYLMAVCTLYSKPYVVDYAPKLI